MIFGREAIPTEEELGGWELGYMGFDVVEK